MLGRVMKLQFFHQAPGFCWGKSFIQRAWSMGVEVIQDDADDGRIWISHVDQPLHLVRKIVLRTPLRHGHVAPARLRFTAHEEIARTGTLVLIIDPSWTPRTDWQGGLG